MLQLYNTIAFFSCCKTESIHKHILFTPYVVITGINRHFCHAYFVYIQFFYRVLKLKWLDKGNHEIIVISVENHIIPN